jgi:hypothetical protein
LRGPQFHDFDFVKDTPFGHPRNGELGTIERAEFFNRFNIVDLAYRTTSRVEAYSVSSARRRAHRARFSFRCRSSTERAGWVDSISRVA